MPPPNDSCHFWAFLIISSKESFFKLEKFPFKPTRTKSIISCNFSFQGLVNPTSFKYLTTVNFSGVDESGFFNAIVAQSIILLPIITENVPQIWYKSFAKFSVKPILSVKILTLEDSLIKIDEFIICLIFFISSLRFILLINTLILTLVGIYIWVF